MAYFGTQKTRILYKLILKLHRGLPEELQTIGTNYARDEFKRHKNCSPQEAAIFLNEWTNYAVSLAKQLGARNAYDQTKFGVELPQHLLDNLREEQIVQLYELMEAAKAPKIDEPSEKRQER